MNTGLPKLELTMRPCVYAPKGLVKMVDGRERRFHSVFDARQGLILETPGGVQFRHEADGSLSVTRADGSPLATIRPEQTAT